MTLAGLTGVMLSYISRTNANLADPGDVLLLLLSDQTSTATANSSSTIKFILFKQFFSIFRLRFTVSKRSFVDFELVQSLKRIRMKMFATCIIISSQLSSTLLQLLFSFDWNTRVEKTFMQTLACQLSSTLMQLLFSFDQDTKVEKTLMQTLACQLSSTLMQLLFLFDWNTRVEKTFMQTLACQLSSILMQLLFLFERRKKVEKTLMQTPRLPTLINSHATLVLV